MAKVVKYERDESKLHICPAWVIFTMPLVFIVGVFTLIWSIISWGNIDGYISLAVFCLMAFWAVFTDIYYTMYENCRITFKEDFILYEYNLNKSVIPSGSSTVSLKISEIAKLRVKRKSALVWGNISKKAPLRKDSKLSKVEIPINFSERKEIIKQLKERCK